MLKWLKNIQKARKFKAQIAKYQAKTELLRYKNALIANSTKQKTVKMKGALAELEAAEALKAHVASQLEPNTIIQILENPAVKQLLTAGAIKLFSKGQVSTGDDELITLYKGLPADIKEKVKVFAMDYVGGLKNG